MEIYRHAGNLKPAPLYSLPQFPAVNFTAGKINDAGKAQAILHFAPIVIYWQYFR